MLSQDKLNVLHKLKSEEILQIFHECEMILGVTDMDNAEKILNKGKRRIYQLMNEKNSVNVGSHKLPCVNLFV